MSQKCSPESLLQVLLPWEATDSRFWDESGHLGRAHYSLIGGLWALGRSHSVGFSWGDFLAGATQVSGVTFLLGILLLTEDALLTPQPR